MQNFAYNYVGWNGPARAQWCHGEWGYRRPIKCVCVCVQGASTRCSRRGGRRGSARRSSRWRCRCRSATSCTSSSACSPRRRSTYVRSPLLHDAIAFRTWLQYDIITWFLLFSVKRRHDPGCHQRYAWYLIIYGYRQCLRLKHRNL